MSALELIVQHLPGFKAHVFNYYAEHNLENPIAILTLPITIVVDLALELPDLRTDAIRLLESALENLRRQGN